MAQLLLRRPQSLRSGRVVLVLAVAVLAEVVLAVVVLAEVVLVVVVLAVVVLAEMVLAVVVLLDVDDDTCACGRRAIPFMFLLVSFAHDDH